MAYLDHIDEITNHIWLKNTAHQIKFEEVIYIIYNCFPYNILFCFDRLSLAVS